MPLANDDKLMLCTNGDVEVWDPEAIKRELESLRQPGYYDLHCAPKCMRCDICMEKPCPVFG
jgi:hypothetical protein